MYLQVSKRHGPIGRRSDPANEEELVPLALASDSDTMEDQFTGQANDSFQTPPSSPMHENGYPNGDILYKEKVRFKNFVLQPVLL